ncbi:uncharacterized protein ACA1_089060 [Acanthamoeba castellanii str. Neff]|uniref:Uncharacterized protein n=1 Tax=Acanthamoeba castellanii (strain ATCC 30010 / Neff) TaxID=1257118 RepID=L8GU10_ACACF|nr:uncharacterized protein ACA1_089060 [Acanthamoeba castellanii str. Neff]ELR16659.1 hypothetical protein ACA1_089060 [Acanthamoeba castellanii str. Neff]
MREIDFSRGVPQAVPKLVHNLRRTVHEMTWTWRLIFLGMILAGILLVYYKTILVWGTVNPLFVSMYTMPYPPPYMKHTFGAQGAIGEPPEGWKPKSRVVLTLTTMPHHLPLLRPALDSLLAQSLPADKIYLNIPEGRNRRNNMSYDEEIAKHHIVFPTGITVNRCQDVGPLTKLLPAVLAEEKGDPDTIIITVDDDQVYPPDTVKYLAWYMEHYSDTAFGVCGWGFMWVPPPMGVVPVYLTYMQRGPAGTMVDVLQACCGNAYRVSWFDSAKLKNDLPSECFTTDDLWIAGYLSAQGDIKKAIIPKRLDPDSPEWKANEPKKWRLSTVNTNDMKDMKCINGVKRVYGDFKTVADPRTTTMVNKPRL